MELQCTSESLRKMTSNSPGLLRNKLKEPETRNSCYLQGGELKKKSQYVILRHDNKMPTGVNVVHCPDY